MNSSAPHVLRWGTVRGVASILCVILSTAGELPLVAQSKTGTASATSATATKISSEQLDSLVAPIALYPDPLLAQTLAASTYPLEIVQLQQWLVKHKDLKDKALADAVGKESWDPSVQSMAGLPDVVKRLADDVQWTTDLGNAFLAQQSDVMDAVQRMRKKAKDKGNLKSNDEQKVETKEVENKSVVVIEQANPQVVYVPSYNPVVVYGAPVYAYPPIYYPPPGYYAAGMAVSFGVGVAMGAMWSGGWGYGAGWGHNDVDINVNNNFNRNTNINSSRTANRSNTASGKWQHNSQHRGGAPYADRSTADRFGGTARGDSLSNRQTGARDQVSRQGGDLSSARGSGASERSAGSFSERSSSGSFGDRSGSAGDRAGSSGNSSSSPDRAGSRDISRESAGSGSRSGSGFGGGSGGFSGSGARASSSRGSSSFGGSRGGGRRR